MPIYGGSYGVEEGVMREGVECQQKGGSTSSLTLLQAEIIFGEMASTWL